MSTARLLGVATLAALTTLVGTNGAQAHCDGMDGPVVKAAQRALDKTDVNLALIWVKKEHEKEIREAFARTVSLRKTGEEARTLADRYFFETLVRVHRAGEGAPYTGLQPAGRDLGPAIPAVDRALERATQDEVAKLITSAVEAGLRERFKEVQSRSGFEPADVPAGREYVDAYVRYVHYVERLYQAATSPAHGHAPMKESLENGEHDPR